MLSQRVVVNTIRITNGTYVDARPDGRYACLAVDAFDVGTIVTDTGTLAIPGDARPLYLRVTRSGAFKFAGQSSNTPQTIEYLDGTGWVPRATVPCGISPVIYDHSGVLHISACEVGVGTQGYRYVDVDTGAIVSADATYGSDFGLAQWTFLGDGFYIGQCNTTPGCASWDGTDLRMIEEGNCFFIRAQRVGNDVAIAMVKDAGVPSVVVFATMAELRAGKTLSPGGGQVHPPLQHPVVDPATGYRMTQPWAMYEQTVKTGLGDVSHALAIQPTPVPPPAGFGIVAGGGPLVAATVPTDTLTLTSADASVTFTSDALTKTIDLSASGGGGLGTHYDCPLSDGDLVAADLIFAAGECIIVQVPV
jgi:hypothetical protein